MNQQRSRRFRSAIEAKYVNTLYTIYMYLYCLYTFWYLTVNGTL